MLVGDLADEAYERFRQTPHFGESDAAARLLSICAQRSALLLEDEPVLAGRMIGAMEGAGFARVVHVTTGRRALDRALKERFDVVILDRINPDMEGLEVATKLRATPQGANNSATSPILVVTMLGSAEDRIAALLTGARINDYVAKETVDWEELLARVAAQIDVHGQARGDAFALGGLAIDPEQRTIAFAGIDLPLRNRAFDIMLELMRANGRPVTRDMLWERCWNRTKDYDDKTNIINVALSDIRKRIRDRLIAYNAEAPEGERLPDALLDTKAFVYNVWNRGLAIRIVRDW